MDQLVQQLVEVMFIMAAAAVAQVLITMFLEQQAKLDRYRHSSEEAAAAETFMLLQHRQEQMVVLGSFGVLVVAIQAH
jgi:hypothetical protein